MRRNSRSDSAGFGPTYLCPSLAKDLAADAASLIDVLKRCGDWKPEADAKLNALFALLTKQHASEKVLVFTQFADTVRYLGDATSGPRGSAGRRGHRRFG